MAQTVRVPLWFLVLGLATVPAIIGAFVLGVTWGDSLRGLPSEEATILRLAHEQILEQHVDEQDPGELLHTAIGAMVGSLDRYSAYVPPSAVRQFEEDTTGRYEGIGILMATDTSPITVLYPMSGGPAEREGMQVGDQILAIDGEDMTGFSPDDLNQAARERLKGEAGLSVTLTVSRREEVFDLELKRGAVQRESVKWARLLDPEEGIGYLHISDFQEHTVMEFDQKVDELRSLYGGELAALVVDLRFNPGGILDECVALANRFVGEGAIVSLKRRSAETVQVYEADPAECTLPDLPVVVLVNRDSASASEVFAGALRDHGRAPLVGQRTYGKGYVQSIYRWKGMDFRLKLTTSHYYTPDGHRIEGGEEGGLEPDRVVELDRDQTRRIHELLRELEPPARYRAAARALAEELGNPLSEPLPPEQDAQLLAALEEARRLLR